MGLLTWLAVGQLTPVAAPSVRDSGGVHIVLNRGFRVADHTWRLDAAPRLQIGSALGGGPDEFVDIVATILLSDGSLAVVDRGTGHLTFFSATGAHLSTAGRTGGGPGEFSRGTPTRAWVGQGDTVVVWDEPAARLSWFTRAGFAQGITVPRDPIRDEHGTPQPDAYPRALGMWSPDEVVVRFLPGRPSPPNGRPSGIFRTNARYAVIDLRGGMETALARLPERSWFAFPWNGGISVDTIPLGPIGAAAVGNRRLYFASGDTYDILAFDATGRMVSRVGVVAERPSSEAGVEAFTQRRLDVAPPGQEAEWKRWIDNTMPFPDRLPSYRTLLVDRRARVWAQLYPPNQDETSHWLVFDGSGTLVGSTMMPARFRPLDIHDGLVAGVWRDDLDVQFVRIYPLTREVRN